MIFGKKKYANSDGLHQIVIGDIKIVIKAEGDKIFIDEKEVSRIRGREILRNLIVAMEHIERSL